MLKSKAICCKISFFSISLKIKSNEITAYAQIRTFIAQNRTRKCHTTQRFVLFLYCLGIQPKESAVNNPLNNQRTRISHKIIKLLN